MFQLLVVKYFGPEWDSVWHWKKKDHGSSHTKVHKLSQQRLRWPHGCDRPSRPSSHHSLNLPLAVRQPDNRRSWLSGVNTSHNRTSSSRGSEQEYVKASEEPGEQTAADTCISAVTFLLNLDATDIRRDDRFQLHAHIWHRLPVMPHCRVQNHQLIIGVTGNRNSWMFFSLLGGWGAQCHSWWGSQLLLHG